MGSSVITNAIIAWIIMKEEFFIIGYKKCFQRFFFQTIPTPWIFGTLTINCYSYSCGIVKLLMNYWSEHFSLLLSTARSVQIKWFHLTKLGICWPRFVNKAYFVSACQNSLWDNFNKHSLQRIWFGRIWTLSFRYPWYLAFCIHIFIP